MEAVKYIVDNLCIMYAFAYIGWMVKSLIVPTVREAIALRRAEIEASSAKSINEIVNKKGNPQDDSQL